MPASVLKVYICSQDPTIPRFGYDKGNKEVAMARCETCGNEYAKAFTVTMGGDTHVFDCFECAIQKLAPVCEHCGCKILGHGVETAGHLFCCDHCARHEAGQVTNEG